MERQFRTNDYVWAKMRGYPAWPARVDRHPKGMQGPSNKHYVFFYGTHQYAWMSPSDLYSYSEHKDTFYKPCQRKGYSEAVWEIEEDPLLKISSSVKTPKGKVPSKKQAAKPASPAPSKLSRKRKTSSSPRTPTPSHLPSSVKKERLDPVDEGECPLPVKQREAIEADSQQPSLPVSQSTESPTKSPTFRHTTPTKSPSIRLTRSPSVRFTTPPVNQTTDNQTLSPSASQAKSPPPASQPKSPPASHPKSPTASQPKSPPASQPKSPPASQPKSPPASHPKSPPASQPKSPPASQPKSPPASQPKSPPASQSKSPPVSQTKSPPASHPKSPPASQPKSPPASQPKSPASHLKSPSAGQTKSSSVGQSSPSQTQHRYATRRRNAPGIVAELKQSYSARKEQPPLTSPLRGNPPSFKPTSPLTVEKIPPTTKTKPPPSTKTPPTNKSVKGKQSKRKPTARPQTTRLTRRSLRFQDSEKKDPPEDQEPQMTESSDQKEASSSSILPTIKPSEPTPVEPGSEHSQDVPDSKQMTTLQSDAIKPPPVIAEDMPSSNGGACGTKSAVKPKSVAATRTRRKGQSAAVVGSRSSSRLKIKKEMLEVGTEDNTVLPQNKEQAMEVEPKTEEPAITSSSAPSVADCLRDTERLASGLDNTDQCEDAPKDHSQATVSMDTETTVSHEITDSTTKATGTEANAPTEESSVHGAMETELTAATGSVTEAAIGSVDHMEESESKEQTSAPDASSNSQLGEKMDSVLESQSVSRPALQLVSDDHPTSSDPLPVTELEESIDTDQPMASTLSADDTTQVKGHDEGVQKSQSDDSDKVKGHNEGEPKSQSDGNGEVKGQPDEVKTSVKFLRPKRRIKNANASEDSPLKKFKVSEPNVRSRLRTRQASGQTVSGKGSSDEKAKDAPQTADSAIGQAESGKGSPKEEIIINQEKTVDTNKPEHAVESGADTKEGACAEPAREQPQNEGTKEGEKDTVRVSTLPDLPPFITPQPGMSPVQVLLTYNYNLKAALTVEAPNTPRALETLKKLKECYCSAADVDKVSDIVATIKKLKRYRACPQVVEGADEVYQKFKKLLLFPPPPSKRKVGTASRTGKKAPGIMIDYIRAQNSLVNRPQNRSGITNVTTKHKPTAKQLKAVNTPVVPEKPVKPDQPVKQDGPDQTVVENTEHQSTTKAEAPPTRNTRSSSRKPPKVNYQEACGDSSASDGEVGKNDQTVPT